MVLASLGFFPDFPKSVNENAMFLVIAGSLGFLTIRRASRGALMQQF
jgi:hypothetical protein